MRLQVLAAILFCFISACASTSVQAQSDHTTGTAGARIIEPVTVNAEGDEGLFFGNLKTSAHAGSIEIDPETNDYGAITGGITTNNPNQVRHAASFRVTGEPGLQFQVEITGSVTTSPGVVSNLNVYPETHIIDDNGEAIVKVGGTLSLEANIHNFKIYKSDVSITVSYN